jgi:glycolate oxidase FAD binding subunit
VSAATVAADLEAVVGPGRLEGDTAQATVDGVRARWRALPDTAAEVGRCLAVASAAGLAVAPVGGAARLGWGNPPSRLDLVVGLRRLGRVLAYEPADLTISVEAGITLAELDAVVRPHGQMLALDPPRAADTTVGGAIATGVAGPYRARYGTMREQVLGLTVTQADGRLVRAGGRVVKNVTGYDTPKLHVGGLGTLGVVVEAHLRLHPVPGEERTWLAAFPSPEAALEAAARLRDTPLQPSRLQLVAAPGVHAGPALAVTVGSVPEAVADQGGRLVALCREAGGAVREVAAAGPWWETVRAATLAPEPEGGLALRIGVRPGDVVRALRQVEAVAQPAGLQVSATAELPSGVLHAVLAGRVDTTAPDVLARLRDALRALDGTCMVEAAPAAIKPRLEAWGDAGPALPLMRGLKAELDPGRVLNPGRYVGGI